MTRRNPFHSSLSRGSIRTSKWGDRIFLVLTGAAAAGIIALLVGLAALLYSKARPSIEFMGIRFFTTGVWDPAGNVFGVQPFVVGTFVTSGIAMLIAVPLSIGAAIFLTQQAPLWLRGPVGQVIELLAAIPSIVYGFWGLIIFVPIMRLDIDPVLKWYLGWTGLFGGADFGLSVLTAGVVLSIMAIPTITAISRDSIAAVPISQKEAALALGATDWEVTRRAVVPYARSGVFAGSVLGLGRALGETMAVTMVIGNRNAIPLSLFAPGQTITSLLANDWFEAATPNETPALIEAALVLLAITLAINIGARLVLARSQAGQGVGRE
jgi:phosphate transport system permease protein